MELWGPFKWHYECITGVIALLIGVLSPFITGRAGAHLAGVGCCVVYFQKIKINPKWLSKNDEFAHKQEASNLQSQVTQYHLHEELL